jgi:hypothetical protein
MTSKYLKVLKLIHKLSTAKGYTLYEVGDGEEFIYNKGQPITDLYDWATQTDMGAMHYETPSGKKMSFYLIYGNLPSETIYDGGYNNQAEDDWEAVAHEVYEHFEKLEQQYS